MVEIKRKGKRKKERILWYAEYNRTLILKMTILDKKKIYKK